MDGMCACSVTKSSSTLCDSMNCNPPGSSVHVILQARILERVAISCSRDLPNPGIEPRSPALKAVHYYLSHQGSLRACITQACITHRACENTQCWTEPQFLIQRV